MTKREKDLTRRYLVWCYKTTKEALDRIDRYFTQSPVDRFVLDQLLRGADFRHRNADVSYRQQVEDFKKYMGRKRDNAFKQKFADGRHQKLRADYLYLKDRLAAIEKAIVHFLGKKDGEKIRVLYENEMTQRILQAREH